MIKSFTKTELNKLIEWSSSRYNNYKKADVINDIIKIIKNKEIVTKEYDTGSFSPRNHLQGWTYKLITEYINNEYVIKLILPSKIIERIEK